MSRSFPARLETSVAALAAVTVLLAGCGGSSKPGYCSNVNDLKQSVQGLTDVKVVENGTSSLKYALTTVQSNAEAVISSAKSDFPSETSALNTSLQSLSTSVQQLAGTPSAAGLASVASAVSASVSAAKALESSTSSKCG